MREGGRKKERDARPEERKRAPLGRLECARASVRVRECVHTQARLQHAHARSSRKCTQAHQAAGENLAG